MFGDIYDGVASFLALILGGMMMPATMMALTDNGDDYYTNHHRSPAYHPYAYITYNETTSIATISFRTAVADAGVIIYQDGIEVDALSLAATEGMQIPINLSTYGCGDFTIQVKSDTTLLATFDICL